MLLDKVGDYYTEVVRFSETLLAADWAALARKTTELHEFFGGLLSVNSGIRFRKTCSVLSLIVDVLGSKSSSLFRKILHIVRTID